MLEDTLSTPSERAALKQVLPLLVGTMLVLVALVALTCWASYQPLGHARIAVGLGIATIKIALVGWVFMQLRHAPPLIRAVLVLAASTACLLFVLSASDVGVRAPAPSSYQKPLVIPAVLSKPGPR